MNEKILLGLGLTKVQSEIFSCLLQNGSKKASDIAKITKRPRGVAYKGLEELIDLGLAQKKENKLGVALFTAEHPSNLEKVLERREKELDKTKKEFTASLPDLVSAYNLISNKPGVRFYEGEEGIRKVLDDTLKSKTDIYMILNKEALSTEEEFTKLNREYRRKREKAGIIKKIIRIGQEPFHEENAGQDYEKITEIRYLNETASPFKASIQIYDHKISYQVTEQDKMISIIVDNKNIYELHKFIFESLWDKTKA